MSALPNTKQACKTLIGKVSSYQMSRLKGRAALFSGALTLALLATHITPPGASAQIFNNNNNRPNNVAANEANRPIAQRPAVRRAPTRLPQSVMKQKVNQGTVGIIADSVGSTHTRMSADMAAIFDRQNNVRILTILGRGAQQTITDMLYLKGIDFGIVQSDVLEYVKTNKIYPNIYSRISYITKLHNQEFHIIARKDIKSLKDLENKRVNIGAKGTGSNITATAVFKAHDINVVATAHDEINALDKLKLGAISAMVYVGGKPVPLLDRVAKDWGLHLISVPYNTKLKKYLPAKVTHRDYPGLVPEGETVNTIAVRAVLAVFNWRPGSERYKKVEKFIGNFFTKFNELRKPPRHPKWREVNIQAKVPGWKRFPAAEQWVAHHTAEIMANRKRLKPQQAQTPLRQAFLRFMQSQQGNGRQRDLSQTEMDQLFAQFVQWREWRLQYVPRTQGGQQRQNN